MRSKIVAAIIAISTLVAMPAFAKGDHKANFPMPAAAFKQKVDEKISKAREHMEKAVAKLPADKAKEARAKFDSAVAKVNAEVAKAIADGTVTKDEAQKVRETAKELGGHHGKRHAKK